MHYNYTPFFNKYTKDLLSISRCMFYSVWEVLLQALTIHTMKQENKAIQRVDKINVSIKHLSQRGLLQFGMVQKSMNINGHVKIHLILFIFPSAGQRKEEQVQLSHHCPRPSYISLNTADDPRRMFTVVHVSSFSSVSLIYSWSHHSQPSSVYTSRIL